MRQDDSKPNDPVQISCTRIYWIAGITTVTVCLSYFLRRQPWSVDSAVWGQFGDYIGGVLNPVFGLLTLVAVLKTIRLQQLELSEARKDSDELRKSRTDQLSETKRTADIDCFLRAASILQDETLRSDRAFLFLHESIDSKSPDSWFLDRTTSAERVCSSYDLVGILLKKGLLPKDLILDAWSDSIKKSWQATRDLVDFRRKRDGDSIWNHFEWMNKEAEDWRKDSEQD